MNNHTSSTTNQCLAHALFGFIISATLAIVFFFLAALAASILTGCASTSIEIEGYGRYRSDRDSQLDELHFTKSITTPDGVTTEITLDVNGASGNASDVEAARWQTVQRAIDKIPSPPLPIQ